MTLERQAIRANYVRGHHNDFGCYFKCDGKLLEGFELYSPMPWFLLSGDYFGCQAKVEMGASAIAQSTDDGSFDKDRYSMGDRFRMCFEDIPNKLWEKFLAY